MTTPLHPRPNINSRRRFIIGFSQANPPKPNHFNSKLYQLNHFKWQFYTWYSSYNHKFWVTTSSHPRPNLNSRRRSINGFSQANPPKPNHFNSKLYQPNRFKLQLYTWHSSFNHNSWPSGPLHRRPNSSSRQRIIFGQVPTNSTTHICVMCS